MQYFALTAELLVEVKKATAWGQWTAFLCLWKSTRSWSFLYALKFPPALLTNIQVEQLAKWQWTDLLDIDQYFKRTFNTVLRCVLSIQKLSTRLYGDWLQVIASMLQLKTSLAADHHRKHLLMASLFSRPQFSPSSTTKPTLGQLVLNKSVVSFLYN